jgi:threonine/homoserine/homoserine lactone efflux protein
MVSLGHFAAFAALTFLMVVVPGPSVLFTISRALTVGRRDALLTVAGNATGVSLQVVAVAFGLGTIVSESATVFMIVKLVGAAYLIHLGVQALRHRRALSEAFSAEVRAVPGKTLKVLRVGFVVGFANPKSIVFRTRRGHLSRAARGPGPRGLRDGWSSSAGPAGW